MNQEGDASGCRFLSTEAYHGLAEGPHPNRPLGKSTLLSRVNSFTPKLLNLRLQSQSRGPQKYHELVASHGSLRKKGVCNLWCQPPSFGSFEACSVPPKGSRKSKPSRVVRGSVADVMKTPAAWNQNGSLSEQCSRSGRLVDTSI